MVSGSMFLLLQRLEHRVCLSDLDVVLIAESPLGLRALGCKLSLQPPGEHADVQGLPRYRETAIPAPWKWTFLDYPIRVLRTFLKFQARQGKVLAKISPTPRGLGPG